MTQEKNGSKNIQMASKILSPERLAALQHEAQKAIDRYDGMSATTSPPYHQRDLIDLLAHIAELERLLDDAERVLMSIKISDPTEIAHAAFQRIREARGKA